MDIKTIKTKIEKDEKGKYKQIKRVDDYEVHEYETPKNEFGYQIFVYKTEDDRDYVKSTGFGLEADARTYDWREIIEV